MGGHSFRRFIGKKVLVKGEVQTGKTRLLEGLLREALSSQKKLMSLIDMAPERVTKGAFDAGGRVPVNEMRGLRVYRPAVVFAPRLQGRSREEVLRMAEENSSQIGAILDLFLEEPTPILFINDLTLYLHAGDPGKLKRVIDSAETFIGNAYEGESIGDDCGSGITGRERRLLKELEAFMDKVITL